MDMVVSLLAWVAFGFVIGALAKFIMPGKDPGGRDVGGFVITCLLGIAGAAVGGFMARALGLGDAAAAGRNLLDWRTLVFAVCGALVLLAAYRAFRLLAGDEVYASESHGIRSGDAAYGEPASPNIAEIAKSALTPDSLQRISAAIGESPSNTRKTLEAMIPTVLAGAASQAATSSGASRILEMAKESVSGGTDFAGKLADQMTETGIQDLSRDGQGILSSIFGDKLGGMTSWFAKFGGIKSTSVSSLLSMAASLVMGVLGKQALTNGLNASGLAGLLSNQKGWLARMLPSGLGDIPGFSKLSEYVQQAGESIRGATRQGERAALSVARSVQPASKPWMSAIAPVLALCLALIALPLLMRGCATKTITVAKSQPVVVPNDNGPQSNVPTTKTSDVRGRAYPPDLGKMMIVKLPDGADLELPEASFLSGMHKYLADKGDVRPRSFVFERIEFEGAGIKSTGESTNYIKILSALLNAFPGVDLRIEGHTDDIDDQESAKRISLLRAEAVKTLLVERGVPADRIQTKGYGSEKPVVPNDTAENREKNRRIELAIVKQ